MGWVNLAVPAPADPSVGVTAASDSPHFADGMPIRATSESRGRARTTSSIAAG